MAREIVHAGLARELLARGGLAWLTLRSAAFILMTVGWMVLVAR